MKLQLLRLIMVGLVSFSSGFAAEDTQKLSLQGVPQSAEENEECPWENLEDEETVQSLVLSEVFLAFPQDKRSTVLDVIRLVSQKVQEGDSTVLKRILMAAQESQRLPDDRATRSPIQTDTHTLIQSEPSSAESQPVAGSAANHKGRGAVWRGIKDDISTLFVSMFQLYN
jgi:hypothetical protein